MFGNLSEDEDIDGVQDALERVSIRKRTRKTVSFLLPGDKKRLRTMSCMGENDLFDEEDDVEETEDTFIESGQTCKLLSSSPPSSSSTPYLPCTVSSSSPSISTAFSTSNAASWSSRTQQESILSRSPLENSLMRAMTLSDSPVKRRLAPCPTCQNYKCSCKQNTQGMDASSQMDVKSTTPSSTSSSGIAIRRRRQLGIQCPPPNEQDEQAFSQASKAVSFSLDESMLCVSERMKVAFGSSELHSRESPVHARCGSLGLTPLMKAAREGDLGLARKLLQGGADPGITDKRGFDALMYAVRDGYHEMARLLLDAIRKRVAKVGRKGYTFHNKHRLTHMLYAALNGHVECVRVLASFGSKLDLSDTSGATPLMVAAQNNHCETVRQLHALGAALELQDRNGQTALTWAVRGGSLRAVQTLLELGADPNTRDKSGRSPLLFAVLQRDSVSGELLLQYGATVCDTVRLAILKAHIEKEERFSGTARQGEIAGDRDNTDSGKDSLPVSDQVDEDEEEEDDDDDMPPSGHGSTLQTAFSSPKHHPSSTDASSSNASMAIQDDNDAEEKTAYPIYPHAISS